MTGLELLPLVAIVLVFWLLIIRPQQRRQRETMKMQAGLNVGDQVMLTSGFYATVSAIHDERVDVELAPGTVVTVNRAAIGTVVPVEQPDETADESADDASDAPGPSLDKNDPETER